MSMGKSVGTDIVQTIGRGDHGGASTAFTAARRTHDGGIEMSNNDPKTISEKIMSLKSGMDAHAGEIVVAEWTTSWSTTSPAPLAFQEFEALGCEPMREKIVLIPDHFVPNKDIASAQQAKEMREFAKRWKIDNYYEVGRGGVCHQVMVDEGFAAPGRLIVGADSHTCTYGALNAFSTGVGSTEAAAVFAEGRLWFKVPESIQVRAEGQVQQVWCPGRT